MSYDWLLLGISSSAWNFADTAMSTSSKMFERVKSAVSSKYVLRRVVQEPTASEKLLAFFGNGATFLYIVKNGIEIYEICCEPKGKQAVLIAKKVATMVAGTQGSTIGATVGSTVLPGIGTFVGGVAGAVGGEYVVEMEPTAFGKFLVSAGNAAIVLYMVDNVFEIYEILCEHKGRKILRIPRKIATVSEPQGSNLEE